MTEAEWLPYLEQYAWLLYWLGLSIAFGLGFMGGNTR